MSTKVRWLGHSALAIESDGKSILIDPFLTGNPACPISADEARADAILLSHGHEDHLGDSIALAKRLGVPIVSNYEIGCWLGRQGVEATHGMQHGGSVKLCGGAIRVKLTPAFHGSTLPDGHGGYLYGGNPAGFLIYCPDGKTIYDAADTGLFGDMALIGEEGIDLAILPIGDYYTMGPDDAVRAIRLLKPRKVLPIHYNTFPPISQDAEAWAARVRAETSAEPVVLKPGDWLEV